MEYRHVLVQREPPLLTITISRPPDNALSRDTIAEMWEAVAVAAEDEEVRALIVTGAGDKVFVSGAEVREFPSLDEEAARALVESGHTLFTALETLPKPVIAAINGNCLGGGLELALACDLRVAAESARFGLPEINLGIMPGWGGTQRLPRMIGKGRAMYLLLTGERIRAPEAQALGLVNLVVPDAELLPRAQSLARKLAHHAPLALAAIKKAVYEGLSQPLSQALATETAGFLRLFPTADAREGISACLEKRRPRFQGR